jgi:hypothetical protein
MMKDIGPTCFGADSALIVGMARNREPCTQADRRVQVARPARALTRVFRSKHADTRVHDYRDGGGGRSAGGVMSKRCLPVIGSIDRSCSVQKVISLAVCFGSRVYTRLRLSGARKMSGATVMISNSRAFFSLSEMRSVIMTFFPIGTAPWIAPGYLAFGFMPTVSTTSV